MSEQDVVGQIKINFPANGRPEVIIVGEINPRLVPGLTRSIQVAYRQYVHALARTKKKVDMSDHGNEQKEPQEAVPVPDATDNIFDLSPPTKPEQPEELVVEDTLEEDTAETGEVAEEATTEVKKAKERTKSGRLVSRSLCRFSS